MLTRSKASPQGPAAASVSIAASSSGQPSRSHAGSNQRIGAAASAGKRNTGAAKHQASDSASITSPAAAPSSLSGRKRAAAATDGSSTAAAASAATSSNHDQSALSTSQSKRQRGQSSKSDGGAAAAASSAGIDPIPAPSRRPASSAAASSASARSSLRQEECSGQEASNDSDEVEEDDGQEWKPAAVAASAGKLRPDKPLAPRPHRLFVDAKELLGGALSLAQVHLSKDPEELTRAHDSVHRPAAAETMADLARLCYVLMWDTCDPKLPAEQTILRDWLLSIDQLWTQLASSLPRLKLSWLDCDELIGEAIFTGALQAIPALVRRLGHLPSALIGKNPILTEYCIDSGEHRVSLQPYLRLFEFGLDPTEVEEGGSPLSALQLARNFIRDRVTSSASSVSDSFASMQAAVEKAESLSMPSVLLAQAFQQRRSEEGEERQRREALHAQFMHALIPAWGAHSTKVRSLLLDAAPDRLIPPLVDIVARCLDLEGVTPEREAPAEDAAESSAAFATVCLPLHLHQPSFPLAPLRPAVRSRFFARSLTLRRRLFFLHRPPLSAFASPVLLPPHPHHRRSPHLARPHWLAIQPSKLPDLCSSLHDPQAASRGWSRVHRPAVQPSSSRSHQTSAAERSTRERVSIEHPSHSRSATDPSPSP